MASRPSSSSSTASMSSGRSRQERVDNGRVATNASGDDGCRTAGSHERVPNVRDERITAGAHQGGRDRGSCSASREQQQQQQQTCPFRSRIMAAMGKFHGPGKHAQSAPVSAMHSGASVTGGADSSSSNGKCWSRTCGRARPAEATCGGSEITVSDSAAVAYTDLEQLHESFERLNELRASGQLCDVVLEADGGERFPCHRAVLAASCPYFQAMFASQMCESQKPCVPMPNVCAAVLRLVLDFAYTGRAMLCDRSVCRVLMVASMLQMQRLIDACSAYLTSQLDPSNCIGIRRFARAHGCAGLAAEAERYVLANFCKVRREDEFRTLSACELYSILSSEGLTVRCEREVFGAVIEWVSHDPVTRKSALKRLLAGVRLHTLPPQYLSEQLARCDVLRCDDDCVTFLARVLDELSIHKPPEAACTADPRPPGYALVVFCVGGYQSCSSSVVDFYCPLMNVWHRAADMPGPRSGLAACVLQGVLYAVGGRNNSACGGGGAGGALSNDPAGYDIDLSAVDAYEPSTNSWSQLPPMNVARSRVGAAVLDGHVYAVGGSCGPDSHASVERYNPQSRQWTMMPPMRTPRNAVGVAVVNRFLYAIGGSNGQSRLNSMECFHPEKGEWIDCPPMSTPRSGAGVCTLNDCIYVAGGYDSSEQLSSVERYDTRSRTWQLVKPMKRARSALSMAAWNGKLYVLGGYGLSEFVSVVECYDPETDAWRDVTSMPRPRSGLGVAVGILPDICSSDQSVRN